MTTRTTRKATGTRAATERKRANALSKAANESAAVKAATLPTSFRFPAELMQQLDAFVYSDRNTQHLKRTKVVEAAIRAYIGAESEK